MRKGKNGQIIIIAALLMAIVMVSLLPYVYFSAVEYRSLKYEPLREIIDNIRIDFKRALERILASATYVHNESADIPLLKK